MGSARSLMRLCLRSCLLLSLALFAAPAQVWADSPPVRSALLAWDAPQIQLELVEQLYATQGSAFVFPLVSQWAESGLFASQDSPKHLYQRLIDAVAELIPENDLSMLKLSLAIHEAAPAIQAYHHFYNNTVLPAFQSRGGQSKFDPECAVWADVKGRQACSVAALDDLIKNVGQLNGHFPEELPLDHIYGKTGFPLVLYANVAAESFAPLHKRLIRLADSGAFRYILRYRPPAHSTAERLHLSGYGVELAIKSTEYKVTDDRDVAEGTEASATPERVDTSSEHALDLDEETPVVKSLTSKDLRELGLKTAQYILDSSDPLSTLAKVSQNFPKYSHRLVGQAINDTLRDEVGQNQVTIMNGGTSALWLNGIEQDIERLDIYRLIKTIRSESKIVSSLKSLGLTSKQSVDLLTTSLVDTSTPQGLPWGESFDVRDPNVLWWNNLEKDSRYIHFPNSLRELLHPSYQQGLRYIRKNIFSVVICADLSSTDHLHILSETLDFVVKGVPLRFGFIPLAGDDETSTLAVKAFQALWIANRKSRKHQRHYIEQLHKHLVSAAAGSVSKDEIVDSIHAIFKDMTGTALSSALAEHKDEIDAYMSQIHEFQSKFGLSRKGGMFLNGKYIDLDESYQQAMMQAYFTQLEWLTQQIYTRQVSDSTKSLYNFFLGLPGVFKRRNPYIFTSEAHPLRMVNLMGLKSEEHTNRFDKLVYLTGVEAPQADDSAEKPEAKAPSKSGSDVSLVIISDLESQDGVDLALEALEYVRGAPDVRVSFVHNPRQPTKVLNINQALGRHDGGALERINHASEILKLGLASIRADHDDAVPLLSQSFVTEELGLNSGDRAILINGRVVGPLAPQFQFAAEDFKTLVQAELQQRIGTVSKKVRGILGDSRPADEISSIIQKVTSLAGAVAAEPAGLSATVQDRASAGILVQWKDNHSAFQVGDADSASIHIIAVLDPVSKEAQKVSSILSVLSKLGGIHIKVRMNPQLKLVDVPLIRFYRYVLSPEPAFDDSGAVARVSAEFFNMPVDPLLTLGMDVPGAWLVTAVESVHDLDNIKLSKASSVEATFELAHILTEGHAREIPGNRPPRGLQFILGTESSPAMVDTITMANLGYLQFKANPGVWRLGLREGRSHELYTIEGASTSSTSTSTGASDKNGVVQVVLNSFEGVTIYPRVRKLPGKEKEDVLQPEKQPEANTGLWASLKSRVFGAPAKNATTINVFSVASGHLYERFLGIMMLSVVQQTQSPVKFWLIENFLSPKFKNFLPHLAREHKFDYELVTYKWPHWLRAQSEKQRTIWGYKILFLDVLFPLSLDRVIFVDADQVVRTDLKELVELDMNGAPYGYTPFCDSRKEMDGFRFWKHGYWQTHLQGLPYHISALYVVDLVRFREMAAGDRLRQQYQMLSADPNSLANLDQDLPNSMVHQIPIYSLPQEWLWCETWCSDEQLKTAKTIDLCNNPLTKEPKLERARRILPEWEGLDEQVHAVETKVATAQQDGGGGKFKDEL
ncbi:UDP-glucose:glycoprotein glucosyltransferase-domain-containing protein [Polychytrium aggregatum]|uniref:UDP-glucose:glycoprotein glucosyltransferase-domain-containing protein n=1 Tax=Polychytrium aggregatum TaxID=110093 RepID=UPI0022FDFCA5|nr:UDP-glucose:glycoprotein glucosyltransferase-domain-containing protein [Polychytrium aggregatum]KAI9199320.1 UDP-glucose:glycoprotein glucosyltransferase-domain-containing protein [Polychytrium aggregatum]